MSPQRTIEIRYSLDGPFGGFGSFLRTTPGSVVAEIPLAVKGEAANHIRGFAWAPGCRIAKFDVKVEGLDLQESYMCEPLPMVLLKGQVDERVLMRHQGPQEIRVEYLAGWACQFFGFADCMVPQLEIGAAKIDSTRHFEISLPDFASDPACMDTDATGGFQISFWEVKRQNVMLHPALKPLRTLDGGLKAASAYPDSALFVSGK